MNRLVSLVAAISLAQASSWGQMGPISGPHAYGQGMMPNSEMSYGHGMQGIMWPHGMMSGLGVSGSSSGVTGGGVFSSLCKGQMMGSNVNQMSHNMVESEQMEKMGQLLNNLKGLIQQVGSGVSNMDQMSYKADQMSEQIIQQAHQMEQLHMQQAVKEIQQRGSSMVVGSGSSMVPQMAQQQAMNLLGQIMMQLKNGMMMVDQNNVTKQLQKTIEVTIMSQMAMGTMHKQESVHSSMMVGEQMISNFVNHMQQMVEKYNEMQTQIAIMVYQTQLHQVQAQLQFVNQQVESIKMYQSMMMVRESGHVSAQEPQSMQQLLTEMYQHQHHLLAQQVALQMVVTVLQEVMLSQQNMMQELVVEGAQHQISSPSMHMHSMPMMMSNPTMA